MHICTYADVCRYTYTQTHLSQTDRLTDRHSKRQKERKRLRKPMREKAETKGVLPLSDARPLAVLVGAVRFVVAEPLPDLVNLRVCVSLASVKHTRHQPNPHTPSLSLTQTDRHTHTQTHTHTHTHTHTPRERGRRGKNISSTWASADV